MDTHSEVRQIAQILLFCLVPLTPSLWGDCISKEGEILCYFLRLKKASLEELLQMGSYPGRVLRPNDDTLPVFLSWFWSEWGLNKKYSWGLLDRCVENFHGHKWKKKYHKWNIISSRATLTFLLLFAFAWGKSLREQRQKEGRVTLPLPVELERMQDSGDFLPQVPQVDAVIS